MHKNGISVKMMRRILKLTYPKMSLPKVVNIKRFLRSSKRRRRLKSKLPPHNKTPEYIRKYILKCCAEDDGLQSSPSIASAIYTQNNVRISVRTIRRYRRLFGYRYRRLRKAPYLTDLHKLNRLNWCLTHENTDFSNYVFVDETSVRLWDLPLYHWRLKSSYPNAIPMTEKYRRKLNVWGGFSYKGLTRFAVSICRFYKIKH
jgi:hypothetical protein